MANSATAGTREFTLRALLTGIVLGAFLIPCNVYSGLKIGWSFNMSITAALASFAFWRALEPLTGKAAPGILENNINQTTASSAASIISGGLVAPIPAADHVDRQGVALGRTGCMGILGQYSRRCVGHGTTPAIVCR